VSLSASAELFVWYPAHSPPAKVFFPQTKYGADGKCALRLWCLLGITI